MNEEEAMRMLRAEGEGMVSKRFAGIMHLLVGAIYSVAQSLMVDAVAELRQHKDLYRGQVKYDARKALECYDKLLKLQKADLGIMFDTYLDAVDIMDDEMKEHIQKIYWSINGVLLGRNVENHALIARLETAYTVIDLGKECFDSLCKVHNEIHPGFKVIPGKIKWFAFDDVKFHWKRLCETIQGTPMDIDLGTDANCALSLKVLQTKMTDFDRIEQNVKKAMDNHPEADPRIGEGIKMLKQKYGGGNAQCASLTDKTDKTDNGKSKRLDWEGRKARQWKAAQSLAMIGLTTTAKESEKRDFIDYLDTMGVISHKQRKQLIKRSKEAMV